MNMWGKSPLCIMDLRFMRLLVKGNKYAASQEAGKAR